MSGGVDSSVVAYLLSKAGHRLTGFTAKLTASAGAEDSVNRAASVCEKLNIPHVVVDLSDQFDQQIITPFCKSYLAGYTPSPCIRCNRAIKFGALYDIAEQYGCERIATGHYVKIEQGVERRWLRCSQSVQKDQSYFLFYLTQQQLSRALFVLGDAPKSEIRAIAREAGLPVAETPDSQEICFVPDDDYRAFLGARGCTGAPGWIIDTQGRRLGSHTGIQNYTIGQRRGLGISHSEPLYVVDLNAEENLVIAGTRERCARKGLIAADLNYMRLTSIKDVRALVKIRSTHAGQTALCSERDGVLEIMFDEPALNISPGQAAVLYDSEGAILGGGWIQSSF